MALKLGGSRVQRSGNIELPLLASPAIDAHQQCRYKQYIFAARGPPSLYSPQESPRYPLVNTWNANYLDFEQIVSRVEPA